MNTEKSADEALKRAIAITEQMAELESELRAILVSGTPAVAPVLPTAKAGGKKSVRREWHLTPEARKRVLAALKERGLKVKITGGVVALNPGIPTGPQPPRETKGKADPKKKSPEKRKK